MAPSGNRTDGPKRSQQLEADEALEGEIVPAGTGAGPDAEDESEGVLASTGRVAALVAVGTLALAASGSTEEPAPMRRLKKRRRRRGGRAISNERPSPPRLPDWLEDLDRVSENTEIQKRRLTDKGWSGFATEDDAIVFLGYLVRRKTAADAAMVLGNESLLGLALRKKAYGEIDPGFFSDGGKAITRFDINEAPRLAAMLGDKFGNMPLWDRELYRQQEANLRARIARIVSDCEQRIADKQAEIDAARSAVDWNSRKRNRPDRDRYFALSASGERQIDRWKETITLAAKAMDELAVGKRVPAIDFLHAHEVY